ncbi:MAG: AAA family ATPase, partial [Gammaproteobacteria bacterium]|nr:AAA family ATPase [Gammaproteobacteria bacterium]
GIGKHSIIHRYLEQKAAQGQTPEDLCYVHNFSHPQQPVALALPSGQASTFRNDMQQLVRDLLTTLPAAFESDNYQDQARGLEENFKQRQSGALDALQDEAQAQHIKLFRTPGGFAFAPLAGDEVISPADFEKLPEDEQLRIEKLVDGLQEKLAASFRQLPQWRKELIEQLRQLERDTALVVVAQLLEPIRQTYQNLPQVLNYLEAVESDVLDNVEDFLSRDESSSAGILGLQQQKQAGLRRYQINILSEQQNHAAPVIYEDHPTYENLTGRIEYSSQLGTLITDFTLIKPGALHRANGGYLILDANKLLQQPYAWDGLKRALRSKHINIETLYHAMGLSSTQGLEPEPVPLEVKIVLLGDRMLYYLLCQYDADFAELFKVAADFETRIDRNEENIQLYAQLIASMLDKEQLRPMDNEAVARIIEHSSRYLEDSHKLSTHMGELVDLIAEADYWAQEEEAKIIQRMHVQQAIDAQIRRVDRVHHISNEYIERGIVMIDTAGHARAQVNGLTVMQMGNFEFGQPSRITATARLGEGHIINIEREVELSGPIHSKGVMVLSGYLGAHYAPDVPFSLAATLVFEQSYGEIDGDSASAAELICLLSALSGVPVKQSLAITGSINQHGRIQAIGGVNAKIEGFFDICHSRKLDGEQGVIIPRSNVQDLMLREDVVEAVQQGQFHIYAIEQINEAIELMLDKAAGSRNEEGKYPEDTVNYLVEERLVELAHIRHTHGEKEEDETDEEKEKPDNVADKESKKD